IDEYKKALGLNANLVEAHYNLANIYYNEAHESLDKPMLKRALNEYKETIRCDPQHAEAHNMLCHLYIHEGNPEQAIEEGKAALDINLNMDRFHANLARAYIANNAYNKAIKELILAVSLDTRYHWAHLLKGHAHYFNKEFDKALEAYDVALSIELNNPYDILWKYLSLERSKGSDDAKKFLDNVGAGLKPAPTPGKEKQSSSTETWGYDLVHHYSGKLSQDDLIARASDPWKKCDAYFYIGSLKLLKGDIQSAKQNFLKCNETNAMCSSEYVGANIELKNLELNQDKVN
ncbi:MAG: hypothetical protein HY354_06730, partial [Planctomycetes bacterium]|nr:hypothetical protein [Planctomycetota bacterium]